MISIVIPVYNEQENVEALASKLSSIQGDWEAIFVDDGSTDRTAGILTALGKRDSHFRTIRLSRNFGQSAALAAGIDSAKGELVATLDGDGQNDPADIASMLAMLEKEKCDVVCGWRESRNDGFLRVAASHLANGVLRSITGVPLHDYGCTLRVYRKKALEQVQIMGDMHRLLPAYLAWSGAKISEMPVRHHARMAGISKYGILSRTFKVLLDAFLLKFYFSYFTRPIYFFGSAALGLLGAAVLIEGFVAVRRIFWGGDWISPLFFLGLFCCAMALLFLFMGALADLMVRNYVLARNLKPYHILNHGG